RNFADPDWGMKVTGKEGKNAVGFYAVQDRKLNLLFPGNEGSEQTTLDGRNYGSAARYRRDVLKNSTVGLIFTDREADDFYNRVAGMDANFRFRNTETVRLTFLGSQTKYPGNVASDFAQPDRSFTGGALDVYYLHNTKGLDWYAQYRENGTKFRGHLGFIPMADWRFGETGWGHTWNREAGGWFTEFNVGSCVNFEDKLDGTPMSRSFVYWIDYTGPMQSEIHVNGNLFSRMYYRSLDIDWNSVNLFAKVAPAKSLTLYFDGRYGNNIDYSNEREGVSLRLNPWFEYKIGRHLSVGLDHTYELFDVDGGRLYTATISRARLVYQFSRRMFLRSVLQHVNYDRNTGLYTFDVSGRDENFFTQLLFSYKINPQTVLYLGYSDNYFGDSDIDLTQTDRTFFAKIGYALVL
ncbi:MAG: hypothetical protein MUF59_10550, partial [Candidatus Krumholzibacteria bacterium]|nr:hypothetical protein [Candidatus Krumholzibacteria bacterium]